MVSLLPLSHLMEQATALFYAMTVGADILYVRSRNPRVIFEAIRDHRVTTMLVVPQILDLFWGAIEATEEAILNALVAADTMVGRDDITAHALDHGQLVEVMTRYGRGPVS